MSIDSLDKKSIRDILIQGGVETFRFLVSPHIEERDLFQKGKVRDRFIAILQAKGDRPEQYKKGIVDEVIAELLNEINETY